MHHPNRPIILRNSLIFILSYAMAQKREEVKKWLKLEKCARKLGFSSGIL